MEKLFELAKQFFVQVAPALQNILIVVVSFIITLIIFFIYYRLRSGIKKKKWKKTDLDVAKAKDEYRKLYEDKDKLYRAHQNLKDENQRVVDEYRLLKKENERLRHSLEEERKKPVSAMIFSKEEIKRLKDTNKQLGDQIDELAKQNKKLIEESYNLKHVAEKQLVSIKQKFQAHVDEVTERCKVLTGYNNELKESIRVERHKHFEEVKKLRLDMEQLKLELSRIGEKKVKPEKKSLQVKKPTDMSIENKALLDSVGYAEHGEKSELGQLRGVGPFIEKKLNNLGIYTIKQVSRLNKKDIERVTKLLKYFPGRIERDKWVLQAKELLRVSEKKLKI